VLDAAAELFADNGVHATTRRDVAEAANVAPSLINRAIGSRDDLVAAVLDDLARQLAESVAMAGFQPPSFDPDSPTLRWVRIASQVAARRDAALHLTSWNPVQATAEMMEATFGLDPVTARVRAMHVFALAFGWRLLEPVLIEAAGLVDVPIEDVRAWLFQANQQVATLPLATSDDV